MTRAEPFVDVRIAGPEPGKLDPHLIDVEGAKPTDLEEMTLLAMRDGMAQVESISTEEMGKVTGGLNLPGLM